MQLNQISIVQCCVRVPESIDVAISLPSMIQSAVIQTQGHTRLVSAQNASGRFLSQPQFAREIDNFWPGIDAKVQQLLLHGPLNPRAQETPRQLQDSLGLDSIDAAKDFERGALLLLNRHLQDSGVTVATRAIFPHDSLAPFYYIPRPETGLNTIFVNGQHEALPRKTLEELILSFMLPTDRLGLAEALFAMNAYVSAFSLLPREFQFLLGRRFSEDEMMTALKKFQGIISDMGYDEKRVVKAQPIQQASQKPSVRKANHRQVYETQLRHLEVGVLVNQARTASAEDLYPYCYATHKTAVIMAVLQNTNAGPMHARLIAAHHQTSAGITALCSRTDFLRDDGVQRGLMRNPQAPEGRLRAMFQRMTLLNVSMKITGHETSQKARTMAKEIFREKFASSATATSDKVQVLMRSEGRCLDHLPSAPLDLATINMLKQRKGFSHYMIQRFKRIPGIPRSLIVHMEQNRKPS
ncbi:hypothetical protein KJ708_02090 [bacterium]|nr:hypothetical protein [bacterium]